jgi:prephenate dehydrogenase
MGASFGYALRGFRDARRIGADRQADVCRRAEAAGAVDSASVHPDDAMGADLVIFCVYAHHIPPLLAHHADALRPGAVVSDICGVKSELYARLPALLPEGVDYVGIHPMAGKERDGFENAAPDLYRGAGLIICPLPVTKPESVDLMREMARHIGIAHLAVAPPGRHDAVIAYTSDLMHIAAAGLCMDYHPEITSAFTAGAYRDSTRVADINADAWTELLLDNRVHTQVWLDRYIENLRRVSAALAAGDADALYALLARAGQNKREMLKR